MFRSESETSALPIDIYRTVVGILAFTYFFGLQLEWREYTSPDGCLDHDLVRRIFWFTRISLYQPWLGDAGRYLLFVSGWLATLGVIVGWRPRVCAAWAWAVATSHFRWNFPVGFLNDSAVLMSLFWCILLPTGRTLVWWKRPYDWESWRQQLVPSGVVRWFVANLALSYWVTGLSKLGSEYWLKGVALYCALKLNISRTQDWWDVGWVPWTRPLSYGAVAVECLLPLVFFLRVGHPLRWAGLVVAVGLHSGILLSIGVEYANILWILSWLLVLREEVSQMLGWARSGINGGLKRVAGWETRYAGVAVLCIGLAMSEGVPGLGYAYGLGFALQWSLGLSQEYHLFDWIGRFNFVIWDRSTLDGRPLRDAYPPGLRGLLLQSYLYDMRWMRLPRGQVGEWQYSLKQRLGERLARRYPDGKVVLASDVTRLTLDNLDGSRRYRLEPWRFTLRAGKVIEEE